MPPAQDLGVIWTIFSTGGFPALVFLITWAGMTGRWRWGREYEKMEVEKDKQIVALTEDRDYWKDLSVELLRVQEQTSQVVGAAVRGRRKAVG